MLNRLTILRAAAALLYLGPLLAGLAGAGWSMVPVFVALFLLWIFLLRPDLAGQRAWLPRLERAAVQTLLVVVFFGIGRGIGGILGVTLGPPAWTAILISVMAILLGRLVLNPPPARPEPSAPTLRDL